MTDCNSVNTLPYMYHVSLYYPLHMLRSSHRSYIYMSIIGHILWLILTKIGQLSSLHVSREACPNSWVDIGGGGGGGGGDSIIHSIC